MIVIDGIVNFETMVRLSGADGSLAWQVDLAAAVPWLLGSASLAFDADGDVVVGGRVFPACLVQHAFVAKYDADSGARLWEQTIAGDTGGDVLDVAVDGQNRVVASAMLSRSGMPSEPMVFTASPRLPGKRLLVQDNALDPTKRKLVLKTQTADILAPGATGPGDPTLHGATLEVTNPITAESVLYVLPAVGWTTNSATNGIAKYAYCDRTLSNGPCRSVKVQTGQRIVAKCVGAQFGFTLDELAQTVLKVRLAPGTNGFPYCLEFGPGVRDFPTVGNAAGIFEARDSAAPSTCAGD